MTTFEKDRLCVNCQTERVGEYCQNCGEQKLTPELRSVSYIISHIISDLTSLDGKVWKTALTVMTRPGQLEKDFSVGRRVGYMKPITLFFLFNVLFVMFSTGTDFYVSFYDQLHHQPFYSKWLEPHALSYIASQNIELVTFAAYYDQLVKALARSMIILQVPFFTVFVSLIFYNKKYYAGDYFTYSLNAHGWLLIWMLLLQGLSGLISFFVQAHYPDFSPTVILFPLIIGGFSLYFLMAARRMFDLSWWQCIWRLPILFSAFLISHMIFRFLQFFITSALVNVN